MPRPDGGGRRRGFLAPITGIEVVARSVAPYDGPPAVRVRKGVPQPGQNLSLGLRHGHCVPASVDEPWLSGTFRGSAGFPLDGVIVRPREPPTLVGRMGLALAHRS